MRGIRDSGRSPEHLLVEARDDRPSSTARTPSSSSPSRPVLSVVGLEARPVAEAALGDAVDRVRPRLDVYVVPEGRSVGEPTEEDVSSVASDVLADAAVA